MASAVVGVVGGSGGAGATTFAAALAAAVSGPSVLIDVDIVGGGMDVALGLEAVSGARWAGLQLGGGRLAPHVFEQGLVRWGTVSVLADPRPPPSVEALEQVLHAAQAIGPVTIDIGRAPGPLYSAVLAHCDLVVVVVVASVTGLATARRMLAEMPDVSVGAVLRRGPVRRVDAAELLGIPVLAALPDALRQDSPIPQSWLPVARGVRDGLTVGAS